MANRLTGTRLGRLERQVFFAAASSQSITPTVLDPEGVSRSVQQSLLRASKKLSDIDFVERRKIYREGRARDSRLDRPFFADGLFWLHQDPRRRHFVTRIAIWRTAFGEAIYEEFISELQTGRSIRWNDRRVQSAQNIALHSAPSLQRPADQFDDRSRAPRPEEEEARHRRSEYLPPQVTTEADRERWQIAVRLARVEHPNLGSRRLLEETIGLFSSTLPAATLFERAGPERESHLLSYSPLAGWRPHSGSGRGPA